jgi:hypothetical protein
LSSPYGDDIVLVEGSQLLSTVSNTGNSSNLIAGNAYARISPDSMSGTIAALGNRYNKYFFTQLVFEFVPYQPNSTDGHGFAFGFNPDGIDELAAITAGTISTLEHSMVLPMTGFLGGPEMNCLEVCPSRKANPWYWNEDDGSNAGYRQTVQGLLYGVSDSAITNATTWGTIWCHYKVEFCDITPDKGFTLREARRLMRDTDYAMSLCSLVDEFRAAHVEGAAGSDSPETKLPNATIVRSLSSVSASDKRAKGWSII